VINICARFLILDENEVAEINKIVAEIGMKYDGKGLTMKTGEIFPTDNAPIVSLENGKPSILLMKWGFPKWDGKGVVINARSETAAQKQMFAEPLARRRCVIPSTGFFEWEKLEGKAKQKFRFNTADSPMLYMAGLYTDYNDQNEDKQLTSRFVILTRQANDSISDIHDRMPVILYKDEIRRWLTDLTFANNIMNRDSVRIIRTAA
jgi:putative SOS response-associated peptidase YedK